MRAAPHRAPPAMRNIYRGSPFYRRHWFIALLIVALDGFAHRTPPPITALLFATSIALFVLFVRRQGRLEFPMLHLELFRIERFSLAAATSLCSFTAQGLAVVALPFLYQVVFGYTPPFNMTGQPSLSLPLGMSSDKMPIGMMFTSRYSDEATLFRLAAQLEQARPWHDRRPMVWG